MIQRSDNLLFIIMLKLSLIIPVYNEERHIGACLNAISKQTVAPSEVIVVDNNCTDRTLEIAESYDFVTIVKETNQGRGHARNKGFNSAKGDILGRIDADSRIDPNWTDRVLAQFKKDDSLVGITGIARTDIIPGTHRIKSKLISRSYYWFAHAGFNTTTMWGANMAIKASEWQKVADKVCLDDSIVHEDQDLSLWIAASGGKIIVDNKLLITTNGQTYRYMPKLFHYISLYHSTRKLHRENGNLYDDKLPRLGMLNTFPGRIMGTLFAVWVAIVSIIFFPIDFVVHRVNKNSSWLD
jgi:glycosyltransferase involved in cell wall biosynthesis